MKYLGIITKIMAALLEPRTTWKMKMKNEPMAATGIFLMTRWNLQMMRHMLSEGGSRCRRLLWKFKTVGLKLYHGYIKKHRKLVENEVSFYNEEEDENYYLSEYKLTGYAAGYDPRS